MRTVALLVALPLAALAAQAADITAQPTLTLDGAKRVVAAAMASAPASADVWIGKARTAANFGRPTRGMEDSINKNRPALAAVAAVTPFTPLMGGVPVLGGK